MEHGSFEFGSVAKTFTIADSGNCRFPEINKYYCGRGSWLANDTGSDKCWMVMHVHEKYRWYECEMFETHGTSVKGCCHQWWSVNFALVQHCSFPSDCWVRWFTVWQLTTERAPSPSCAISRFGTLGTIFCVQEKHACPFTHAQLHMVGATLFQFVIVK